MTRSDLDRGTLNTTRNRTTESSEWGFGGLWLSSPNCCKQDSTDRDRAVVSVCI